MGFKVTFREHRQSDGSKILYARYQEPYRDEKGQVIATCGEKHSHWQKGRGAALGRGRLPEGL
jgi:hypothetical protein